MKVLVDPYHWFEGKHGESIVRTMDGETGKLLENIDQQYLQQLRDDLDRGSYPDETLVTRDKKEFKTNWKSIAARMDFTSAPTPIDQYPAYERSIRAVSEPVLFPDLRCVDRYIESPEGVPAEIKREALELAIHQRRRLPAVPSPDLVSSYPAVATNLVDLKDSSDVAVLDFLIDMEVMEDALRSPTDIEHPTVDAWLRELGLIDGKKLTDVGQFLIEYIVASSEKQQQYEMAAVITAAQSSVSQLPSSKLQKAIDSISVDLPEEVSATVVGELLRHRPGSAVYQQIHDLLEAERLDRFVNSISIESAKDVREYVANSCAQELKTLRNDLEMVPVELYAIDPPEDLQKIVNGLDPSVLQTSLDQAISEDRATLDASLEHLTNLVDALSPILDPQRRDRLDELFELVNDLREGLSVDPPNSAAACHALYDRLIGQVQSSDFAFTQTRKRQRENILEICESYIRTNYKKWIDESDRKNREVTLLTDVPDIVNNLFGSYDHVIVIISDGLGLRQWMEGTRRSPKYRHWEKEGVLTNELATTIFPSETGAGHYSFLTGSFPSEHGRDTINKSITAPDSHLFSRADDREAHSKAISYLGSDGSGFSAVLAELADEFQQLSAFRSADSSLSNRSQQAVASHIRAHDRTLTVLQHNQIDQLHESGDHIVDTLLEGVTSEMIEYIEGLATALNDDICLLLTADHGMLQVDDNDLMNVTDYQLRSELKNRGYETDELGQRIVGLEAVSGGHKAWGDQETADFEILNEAAIEDLKATTNDKCNGPVLRFKRRNYSHHDTLTATHGGFTFDEMFVPMLRFDFQEIRSIESG